MATSTNANRPHDTGETSVSPEPIAIIGMSCLFPKAQSLKEYWANLKNGVDAIEEVPPTHWTPEEYYDADPKRPDHVYARRGGFLAPVDFDPGEFGISPKTIEATDTSQLLGLIVAQGALIDAGYGPDRKFDREKTSVILGVTGTLELSISLGARLGHPIWRRELKRAGIDDAIAESVVKNIGDAYVAWQEDSFPGLLGNVVAGRIANRLNLGGTNCVVDAACASSISAAHLALLELQSGRAEMAITGGVDTFNDVFMYMCFSKTPALSPTGDARPFDAQADGTILGEGVGMVVMKKLSAARRDGDRIYAVIKGIGASSDGRGKAIYAPSAEGQVRALRKAYEAAGVSPSTVELVEAHATGTRVGDATEAAALKEVYEASGRKGPWCALGSVKSQIGHTKAAAGVAGLMKVVMALSHKVIPPTIKIDRPNPAVASEDSPFYLPHKKRPWLRRKDHPRRAAVSAFGFGGANFHAVVEEGEPEKREIDWDGSVEIVALSAETLDAMKSTLRELTETESWEALKIKAAQSRRDFCSTRAYRLVLVLERDRGDYARLLRQTLDRLESNGHESHWSLPGGAYFGTKRFQSRLGFLFPGQGSQYVGMMMDMACLFPKMQEVLTQADLAYGDMKDMARQLSDFMFPIPGLAANADELNDLALRATEVAQPAIGAISMGALCILTLFGVSAAAAAGHSYGELMALFASGRIDAAQLHELSKLRGELMAEVAGDDQGAMIAVQASSEAVKAILEDERLDLTLANHNAPDQVVLSGNAEEVSRAENIFRRRGVRNRVLPVSAAFHSDHVAEAQRPFRETLERIDFRPPKFPVYANTTGAVYPESSEAARDVLGRQLAEPIHFVDMIESMHADGVNTFVEVGPGAKLTGMVRSILSDREHVAVAMDASNGKGAGVRDLAKTLAQLAALGHPVDLKLWEDGETLLAERENAPQRRMSVKICGANYRPTPPEGHFHPAPAQPTATAPPPSVDAPPRNAITATRESLTVSETHVPPPEHPPRNAASSAPSGLRLGEAGDQASASPASTSGHAPPPSSSSELHIPQVPDSADPGLIAEALRATQESLQRLQEFQGHTARLHKQFLESQEQTQRTFEQLVLHQQRLYEQSLGMTTATPRRPVAPQPKPPAAQNEAPAPPIAPSPENAEPRPPITAEEPPAASADMDRIQTVLLEAVGEKTGYPAEMLQLDMDLESDLGIDSIKRVEILSTLQERLPEAPVVQPEQMASLRTLQQVIDFLGASAPIEAPTPPLFETKLESAPTASSSNGSSAPKPPDATETFAPVLLEIVSEKTGYPAEMLDLDMDMESDLGIDSIKRVEIFSGFQERVPEAPVVQPEDLARLRTLGQILEFLGAASDAKPAATPTQSPSASIPAAQTECSAGVLACKNANGNGQTETPPSVANVELQRGILQTLSLGAGESRERLDPPAGARILVTQDGAGLADELARRLESRGFRARIVGIDAAGDQVDAPLAGLIVLAPEARLEPGAFWSPETETFLKNAFRLAQRFAPRLRETGARADAALMTVSRLDGLFGLSECELGADPVQGGLAGLAKTAWHEWPEVNCKAVDVAADWSDHAAIAEALLDELFIAGPTEVGLSPEGRHTLFVGDSQRPAAAEPASAFSPEDVIVMTGGARGVTAETALALAQAWRPKLVLLGRTDPGGEEPDWLRGLNGESEIKRAIVESANGQAPSPRKVEGVYRRTMAEREIRRNLERIRAAGAVVDYRVVDVRDAAQVQATLEAVRAEHGPIRGLIHGAGVLADRKIEDKSAEQFDAVFDTKVVGLRNLLSATAADPLRSLVLFSSISGRLGRAGQVDYAMANEALNKIARQQAQVRRDCRVVAVNWGPWDGGMVTPALRKVFATEGVGLIPLEAGSRWLVEELASPARNPEIVVVAKPDVPATAGDDNRKPFAEADLAASIERKLNLIDYPFLRSHVINGNAVLPMAMIMEWLAHGALHANPGFAFQGFDELRVYRGVALKDNEPYSIRMVAAKAEARAAHPTVRVELRGGPDGEKLHAAAQCLLGYTPPTDQPTRLELREEGEFPHSLETAYEEMLFHGEHFRGIEAIERWNDEGLRARAAAAPPPEAWIAEPLRSAWLTDPLTVDAAFQLVVLWSADRFGSPCLPTGAASYRQYAREFPRDGARVTMRGARRGTNLIAADLEFVDADGNTIARLDGCEFVIDANLHEAFRKRTPTTTAAT